MAAKKGIDQRRRELQGLFATAAGKDELARLYRGASGIPEARGLPAGIMESEMIQEILAKEYPDSLPQTGSDRGA